MLRRMKKLTMSNLRSGASESLNLKVKGFILD
jgi:hypothetical protein